MSLPRGVVNSLANDLFRSRIPKSIEQTEGALQSDSGKLFSSGRRLCKIKAVSISVEEVIRLFKANLGRETYFHCLFYGEGRAISSAP